MTVSSVVVGATGPTRARVVGISDASSVRLAVSTSSAMSSPTFFGPESPDAQDRVSITATGLQSDRRYWFALEEDSVVDTTFPGTFLTHPPVGEPGEVVIGWSSCAGGQPETPGLGTQGELAPSRLSNHEVFDTVRQRARDERWLFWAQLGDKDYYDLGSGNHGIAGGGSLANFRASYTDVLAQPRQHQLYRELAWIHEPDDHDGGINDHDGTYADKDNRVQAYRERVPHYELTDSDALYQSWHVRRILFVLADVRYYRSPNGDTDDSSKTMLGQAQKDWMRSVLESSDAEFFVWLMPDQWHPPAGSSDSWDSFRTERDELIQMFADTGWINRMCICSGDLHALAFDTGANSPGGIPVFQAASMDSQGTGGGHTQYDLGTSAGNNRYGRLRLVDNGTQVTVTATGFIGDTVWQEHTFTVGEAAPEPEPEEPGEGLEQVAQAVIRTRLTWLACNLADGALIEELPDLDGDEVSRVIGEYTSANLSLPIPSMDVPNTVPADERLAAQALLATKATEPRRTMIVCVINDVPTYAGIPLPRDLGTDADIPLGLVSLEGYLRHRYIGDHTYNEQDVALIADGILRDAGDTDDGQGIGLIIDAPNTGVIASREYLDIDDQPVYDGLSELMDAGLIEWTIDVDWRDGFAYRIVDKIARVRGRLGRSGAPQTIFQSATFSSEGGSSASYLLKEDYSGDGYANVVRLSGAGEGVDQPRSAPAIDQAQLDSGVPVWELRDSAPQTVTQQALLDLHAERLLDRVRSGARTLEIVARWDAPGARYGVDWSMGDDVGHELKGHAHPGGLNGARRAIGFALSIQRGTIRPILQEDL